MNEDFIFSENDLNHARSNANVGVTMSKSNEDKFQEIFSEVSEGVLQRLRKWTSFEVSDLETHYKQVSGLFDALMDVHTERYGNEDPEWGTEIIRTAHEMWRAKMINDKVLSHMVDETLCY